MRRELTPLESIGMQALDAQVRAAQQAVSEALKSLGFTGERPVRNEGNVLTDEEPDAKPNSTDN